MMKPHDSDTPRRKPLGNMNISGVPDYTMSREQTTKYHQTESLEDLHIMFDPSAIADYYARQMFRRVLVFAAVVFAVGYLIGKLL